MAILFANVDGMLKHEIGVEYADQGHQWMNALQTCGCIMAICIDIEPADDFANAMIKLQSRLNAIKALTKEAAFSTTDEINKRLPDLISDQETTQLELSKLLSEHRKEYDLAINVDFNGQYFFVKLRQGPDCPNR
jgi:hypothetical protein